MDALVITLREGIEAALVVAIIFGYLAKSGRAHLGRYVYFGIIAAIVFSVVMAVVLSAAGIDLENEYVEGTIFFLSSAFVTSMVVWMWRTGRHLKQQMETKIATISADERSHALQAAGIFAFTFFMIAREGVETVLFLSALSLANASQVMTLVGGVAGLALAAGFGVLFVRGSIRIDLHSFFTATSVVLLLLALRFFAGGLHEFAERGVWSLGQKTMTVIGFIVRDDTSVWFLILLLAIPMIATVRAVLTSPRHMDDSEGPVERRKALARSRHERRWTLGAVGFTAVLILVLAGTLASAQETYNPQPVSITAQSGTVQLKTADVSDGRLHIFQYETSGTQVRFIVVKKAAGLGVGLNACQVCGPKGYAQEGENLICKNCNAPIPVVTVGDPGGCNPIALKHEISDGVLSIGTTDLARAAAVSK